MPTRSPALLAALALLLPAGGCTIRSNIRPSSPSQAEFSGRAIDNPGPFAPISLRVHPLTHIATLAGDQSVIILHLEFKDRWHHTVKAAGPLEVQLYRPVGGLRADVDRQDLRWPLELDDLERNADWFDPVTRTYRIQLETPPGIIPPEGSHDATLRLRAIFITRAPDGSESILRDDFVIQR
ncbi:MAG: hypothetical protein IT436_12560 [Phycisphaerales bacterium]|nr:hypothetical protein [Phycisphaerales bacterium]